MNRLRHGLVWAALLLSLSVLASACQVVAQPTSKLVLPFGIDDVSRVEMYTYTYSSGDCLNNGGTGLV